MAKKFVSDPKASVKAVIGRGQGMVDKAKTKTASARSVVAKDGEEKPNALPWVPVPKPPQPGGDPKVARLKNQSLKRG